MNTPNDPLRGPVKDEPGLHAGSSSGSEAVHPSRAGHQAAESVNHAAEVEYWKSNFALQSYAGVAPFHEFEPVFRATIDAYVMNPDGSWEHVEPLVREQWMARRGKSGLVWTDVRDAARDAWSRLAALNDRMVDSPQRTAAQDAEHVAAALRESTAGFVAAADRSDDPARRQSYLNFARERSDFHDELRSLRSAGVESPGREPSPRSRGWRSLFLLSQSDNWQVARVCEHAEGATLLAYRRALENPGLTAVLREALARQYLHVKDARDQIRGWADEAC